jgi:bifunctional non-homologous end joining protein LigD
MQELRGNLQESHPGGTFAVVTPARNVQKEPMSRGDKKLASRLRRSFDIAAIANARPSELPDDLAPQLARPADSVPSGKMWLHEMQREGVRMLARVEATGVRFLGNDVEAWHLPTLERVLANIAADAFLLDGQLVALQADGTSSLRELRRAIASGRTAPLVYGSFDLLYLDGFDLTNVELAIRKELLKTLLTLDATAENRGALRYVHHFEGNGAELYTEICRLDLSGIVSKLRTSRYRSGPSTDWLEVRARSASERRRSGSSIPGLAGIDRPRLVARGIVRARRSSHGNHDHYGKR